MASKKRSLPPRPTTEAEEVPEDEEEEAEVPEDEEEEDADAEEVKPVHKKNTIERHLERYDQVFELLDVEINRRSRGKEKGIRVFRSVRKTLVQMRKEVPHIVRSRSARIRSSTRKNTTSGLMMSFAISEELADFLKLPRDTKLSRIDATRAICIYSNIKENEEREEMLRWKYLNPQGKRDLQNPRDKKSIVPDKALSKVLGYEKYKKDIANGLITKKVRNKDTGKIEVVKVVENQLFYYTIQRLLNKHFCKAEPVVVAEEEDAEETEEEVEEDAEADQ